MKNFSEICPKIIDFHMIQEITNQKYVYIKTDFCYLMLFALQRFLPYDCINTDCYASQLYKIFYY